MAALFLPVGVPSKQKEFRLHEQFLDSFTSKELHARFRFRKTSIEYITGLVEPEIRRLTKRNHALTPTVQVLIALRFYASGAFLQVVGDSFGVDKSTVSRAVTCVSQALVNLRGGWIKWPTTEAEKRIQREAFFETAGFPCVIGCIDGTHIKIQAPHIDEPSFVNRKQYHSINVQGVCDSKSRFTNIVAKWPGATHDSHIFRMSQLYTHMEENNRTLDDGLLLGDSGYGLRAFLMTPYPNPTNAHQTRFNSSHKKTRSLIERTFGQWKRRFHVLHTEIRMAPQKACLIIGACAVLHNIAKVLGEPDVEEGMEDEEGEPDRPPYNGDRNDGRALRNHIANVYF